MLHKHLQYADLDEFLSENNIPDGLPGTHLGHPTGLNHRPSVNDSLGYSTGLALGLGHITTKRERSPSPSDCVSPDTINPPSPAESSECSIRFHASFPHHIKSPSIPGLITFAEPYTLIRFGPLH